MCIKATKVDPWQLQDVPDHFKTQDTCDNAVVMEDPWLLRYVPDWFVTQQQIKIWHDDDVYYNNNGVIKWCNCYQKRMVQKAKIKGERLPIAQHPLRWLDWCVPEDKKKETENLWA